MSRLVVVVPFVEGARSRVEELLKQGPPFEIEKTHLTRHDAFLTDHEVVFDFETPASNNTKMRKRRNLMAEYGRKSVHPLTIDKKTSCGCTPAAESLAFRPCPVPSMP